MPMKSLPMMRAYDPDSAHKPIAPKAVSDSNFLGSKNKPKRWLILWILSWQAEKETVVSVETQVKDLLQVC